ncbi:hypothetical protein AB0A70_18805 [Streptomyces morookaense]|uniref:hypothetical protein n=1 Tax=Streptomyces morookaense TaxID=1970 RepID=UPI0033FB117D
MRVPSAHSALTRIAAVAVTAMALGGCMSVSDPGRPAPSGTDRQRESGPQADGAVRLPGDRPGRADAKALRSASGSPSAKGGGRSASPSAEASATPGVSPPAARPGKPAPSKPAGGQTGPAPGRPTPPDRPPTPTAGSPSSPASSAPESSAPPSPQPGPKAGPAS